MDDINTRKLIELYRRTKSKRALEVLIINHQKALSIAIKDLPKNIINTEDLFGYANDFLILAIQKKFDLRKKIKFISYLITATRFYCIDKIRAETRSVTVDGSSKRKMLFHSSFDEEYMEKHDDFYDNFEKKELSDILIDKIQELPRNEQVVFGCLLQGITISELAKQVGCSVSRISQLYTKGLKKLKTEMEFAK